MILRGEQGSERRNPCPNATLPATNSIRTGSGSSPGIRGDRSENDRLSHGTACIAGTGIYCAESERLHTPPGKQREFSRLQLTDLDQSRSERSFFVTSQDTSFRDEMPLKAADSRSLLECWSEGRDLERWSGYARDTGG